jgi:hypothetical protein
MTCKKTDVIGPWTEDADGWVRRGLVDGDGHRGAGYHELRAWVRRGRYDAWERGMVRPFASDVIASNPRREADLALLATCPDAMLEGGVYEDPAAAPATPEPITAALEAARVAGAAFVAAKVANLVAWQAHNDSCDALTAAAKAWDEATAAVADAVEQRKPRP